MSKRAKRTTRKDAESLWPVGSCWSPNVFLSVTLGTKFGEVILLICVDRKLADGSIKQVACVEVPPDLIEALADKLQIASDVLKEAPGLSARCRWRE